MKRRSVFVLFAMITTMAFAPPARGQDDSTILPVGAVNATEILNEPGVTQGLGYFRFLQNGAGPEAIATSTITVPTAGYVLAIGSGDIGSFHQQGTRTVARVGVSSDCEGPTLDGDQSNHLYIPEGGASGYRVVPYSAQKVFPRLGLRRSAS